MDKSNRMMRMAPVVALLLLTVIGVSAGRAKGRDYYVSANGNDENDGLCAETPLKSIRRVNALELAPGDRVLFRRGDVWNGEQLRVSLKQCGDAAKPVTFGAYGSGTKPQVRMCRSASDETDWEEHSRNVWRCTVPFAYSRPPANPFVDHDFVIARQVTLAKIRDPAAAHSEADRSPSEVLDSNGSYVVDRDKGKDRSTLFVYCDRGNPGAVYDTVEVPYMRHNILIEAGVHHVVLQDIHVTHGAWSGVDIHPDAHDLKLLRMDASFCGGGISGFGRAGQGINIRGSAHNIEVAYCRMWANWDGGVGIQGHMANKLQKNIAIHDNVMWMNDVGVSFWNKEPTGVLEDIRIRDNVFAHMGKGWSTFIGTGKEGRRGVAIWTWGVHRESKVERILVTGNVFFDPTGAFVKISDARLADRKTYTLDDNEYYRKPAGAAGVSVGPGFVRDLAQWRKQFGVDQDSVETSTPTRFSRSEENDVHAIGKAVVSMSIRELWRTSWGLVLDDTSREFPPPGTDRTAKNSTERRE